MSESEQTKKDACWEVFKAEREVACLKRAIDSHMEAAKTIGVAWERGTLYALPNGMLQARAGGRAINGSLGSQLPGKLREYQDAVRLLEEKKKSFQDLLS